MIDDSGGDICDRCAFHLASTQRRADINLSTYIFDANQNSSYTQFHSLHRSNLLTVRGMFLHHFSRKQNKGRFPCHIGKSIHHTSLFSSIPTTKSDFNTDSESGPGGGAQDSVLQSLDNQHPRSGPGALEAQVCVLDPGSASGGEGSGKRQMGKERSAESSGRVGEERTGYEGRGLDATNEVTYYVGPNGWIFYPDSSGYSKEEVLWKERIEIRQHTYSRVVSEDANAVESLGESQAGEASLWDAFPDLS